jgi:hypothetical protein
MSIPLSIHAHPRYLIVTNAFALVLVELLLFLASRVRVLLSPLAWAVFGLAVLAGFAADIAIWYWTGVRAVEVSEGALTIFRGPLLSVQTLPRASVASLTVQKLLGVGAVRIRTSKGLQVRISESAFPREEFRRFLSEMESWKR